MNINQSTYLRTLLWIKFNNKSKNITDKGNRKRKTGTE